MTIEEMLRKLLAGVILLFVAVDVLGDGDVFSVFESLVLVVLANLLIVGSEHRA